MELRRHYENVHGFQHDSMGKGSVFYKYLCNMIKKKAVDNNSMQNLYFCDQCNTSRNSYDAILKHKISKHYNTLTGGALNNNKDYSVEMRDLSYMDQIKISIDSITNSGDFGWKDPKLIDVFLEESTVLVNSALEKIKKKKNNNLLKLHIKFSLTNVQRIGNDTIFSLPKYFSTRIFNSYYYSDLIRDLLRDEVKKCLLISEDAGSAFQFYSYSYIELVILSYKKNVIGEIFGSK